MSDIKSNIADCNGGKHRYLAFGRKAVKLSSLQKDLLDNSMPEFSMPVDQGLADLASSFDSEGPLHFEIGFGNGEYTAALAIAYPDHRIIACEIFLNGISNLLLKINDSGIKNIRIIHGSAVRALEEVLPEGSFDYFHINHPDPWPKKRHHKRRIIQPYVLELIAKALKPHGEVWLSTDVPDYFEAMKECFASSALFEFIPVKGRFLDYADMAKVTTRYEAKGENQGRPARHLRYRKSS